MKFLVWILKRLWAMPVVRGLLMAVEYVVLGLGFFVALVTKQYWLFGVAAIPIIIHFTAFLYKQWKAFKIEQFEEERELAAKLLGEKRCDCAVCTQATRICVTTSRYLDIICKDPEIIALLKKK